MGGDKQADILLKLDKIINLLQRSNPVKELTVMKEGKKSAPADYKLPEPGADKKEAKKPAKVEAKPAAPAKKEEPKKEVAKPAAAPKKAAKPKAAAKKK